MRLIVCLLLFCLTPATAAAQYLIDSWTTGDGLPQSSVFSIVQTPDGFLWISTFGGLARFDGTRFRVFDTTTNPEMPGSRLAGLRVDGEGRLWVITQNRDLMLYDDGRFRVMQAGDGLAGGKVRLVFVYRGELVVEAHPTFLTWRGGRFVADPAMQLPPEILAMKPAGVSLAAARWYRDEANVAHRVQIGEPRRSFALPGSGTVFEDRMGRVWSLDNGRLFVLEGGKQRQYGRPDGVPHLGYLSATDDPDGTVWFCEETGLVRYRDGRFQRFTTADGLPDTYVRTVFRDREGHIWVGTNRGLARMRTRVIDAVTKNDGLSTDNIYPVLQDRAGDMWVGGWLGLSRVRQGEVADVSQQYLGRTLSVLSLMEDRTGRLWVGTNGGGIRRITRGRSEDLTGPDAPGSVHAMQEGAGNVVWIGAGDGAVRYRDGIFTRLRRPDGKTGGETHAFYEDARGTVWIGNEAGLARFANGVMTQLGEADGFTGQRVRTIRPDPDGTLWIGTYDTGLFRYRHGRFTRFTTREGLPSNGAFQVLEDDHGRFWISSNSGIYRVARADLDAVADGRARSLTAVRYDREDGMANQECNSLGHPAGVRARDGRLWFPTQGGIVVVDPQRIAPQPAPPVSILDIAVGGFPTAARDRIEIRSGSRSFQAVYTAVTFLRPELAQFKYRMEGLDDDWVDAGTDHTARYASLPDGNFRFRVIAANREGVWNQEGASIAIVVVPPFYRTVWFGAFVLGALTVAAYSSHRVRLRILERRQAVQEAFARQLIDSQEIDRRRIASELHDGVSQTLVVIKNWARAGEQAPAQAEAVTQRLGKIADAASHALGEVRGVVHELVPYELERHGLAEAIRSAAARVADASGIPIACEVAEAGGCLPSGDALGLFRVVQEALNNVVKHSGATAAAVDVRLAAGVVRVSVRDNGKGFDPAAVTPTASGGFGLVGMSERTRILGGSLSVESAPGRGTTIVIAVPCAAITQEERQGADPGSDIDRR